MGAKSESTGIAAPGTANLSLLLLLNYNTASADSPSSILLPYT